MKSKEQAGKPSEEPELEAVLAEFDMCDQALQMAYQRYIEKPTNNRLHKLQQESDMLTGAFGRLVRKTLRGTDPLLADDERRNALIAMVLTTINNEHSKCIGDYADVTELSTDEELAAAKKLLIRCLSDTPSFEDEEVYIDHLIDHLKNILSSDWDAIEAAIEERQARLRVRLLRSLGETAKIATGAAIGISIVEAVSRRL